MTLETGESVVPPAGMESNSAHVPVPIPLRLMVEHNAQGTTKR